jgi:hypothetical protein
VQELKEGQKEISLNCQRSQEQLNKQLSEKITTEVEKVTTRVEKVVAEMDQVKQEVKKWQGRLEREMIGVKQQFEKEREEQDAKLVQLAEHQEAENVQMKQKIGEIQGIVEHHKGETDREMTSIKVTVNSIQEGLEDGMSDVSRRLWEQQSKIEQKAVVDKAELQGDNNPMEQEVEAKEIMQIEGVEIETSGLSRRVGEKESSYLSQDHDKVLPCRCQLLKFQLNSVSQTKLKFHSKAGNVVKGGRIGKSRNARTKRKLQKWLQVYRKLKERTGRKVNKNRKAKFKRQLQTWLRISNKAKVRAEGREQNKCRRGKFKENSQKRLKKNNRFKIGVERRVGKSRKGKFKERTHRKLGSSVEEKKRNYRGVTFKKKVQAWLKTCKMLESETGRKMKDKSKHKVGGRRTSSNRKVKFKRGQQIWLRAYERIGVSV